MDCYKTFKVETFESENEIGAELSYFSKDGEEAILEI